MSKSDHQSSAIDSAMLASMGEHGKQSGPRSGGAIGGGPGGQGIAHNLGMGGGHGMMVGVDKANMDTLIHVEGLHTKIGGEGAFEGNILGVFDGTILSQGNIAITGLDHIGGVGDVSLSSATGVSKGLNVSPGLGVGKGAGQQGH